ncbi:MAG: S-layer homology domain-containing protein [Parabacteroides sp.]|nr:S-layer homology domain-containing protein [Parabacteroides sp.]
MRIRFLVFFLAFMLIAALLPRNVFAALPEGVPDSLEAATLSKIEVKNDESGIPYFMLELKIPQSVLDLEAERPADGAVWIEYSWKIDNGSWKKVAGGQMESLIYPENAAPGKTNTYYDIFNPLDEGNSEVIDIRDHTYIFKAQLSYQYFYGDNAGDMDFVLSEFSNEVSVGSGSFYQKASEWSKPELEKAFNLGLIPDILNGADMTKPISREEFCELAVLLYEKVTEAESTPASPNPFKDTTNPRILKAYRIGITQGTSATTFSPKTLINREQCAVMLFRTIKAIKPNGDYGIAGVKDFADQKDISKWAVESTKYMSKAGIILGDSSGNFMPKAVTTAQQAAGYGMATREQAVALTVRTYEKIPEIKNTSQINTSDETGECQLALSPDCRIFAGQGVANSLPGFLLTIKDDGSLWGMGLCLPKEDESNPGYTSHEGTRSPVKLADNAVRAVCAPQTPMACGAYYFITSNGDLYSAGSDENGRLGQGIVDIYGKYYGPKIILKNVKFVNASGSNTVAITNNNELYVWGSNFNNFIPDFGEEFCMTPRKVMDGVVDAAPGEYKLMVVKEDGSLWAWGLEPYDEDGSAVNRKIAAYKIMDNVSEVHASNTGTFAAVQKDGSLWMWGNNFYGQLGVGYRFGPDVDDSVNKPVKVLSGVKTVALSIHTVALKTDGSVYAWGDNQLGECGSSSGKFILEPVKISTGVRDIAATDGEYYLLKTDGSIWGCGLNYDEYAFNGKGQEYQKEFIDIGFRVK